MQCSEIKCITNKPLKYLESPGLKPVYIDNVRTAKAGSETL